MTTRIKFYQLRWEDEKKCEHEERIPNELQAVRRRRELKNQGYDVISKRCIIERTETKKTAYRAF